VDDVFSTRLWGEPLVMYRASADEVVCVRDSCPHRSAPLSMGEVQAPSPPLPAAAAAAHPPARPPARPPSSARARYRQQQHQHHHHHCQHHHHQYLARSVIVLPPIQCIGALLLRCFTRAGLDTWPPPPHACPSHAGRSATVLLPRLGLRLRGQVRLRAYHGLRQTLPTEDLPG
jgi:hypothetical protein